jgi:hypothetical protein
MTSTPPEIIFYAPSQLAGSNAVTDRRVGWICYFVSACVFIGIACYLPLERATQRNLFKDFNLKLPATTRIWLDIPDLAIVGLALVPVVCGFILQRKSRAKLAAGVLQLAAAVAGLALVIAQQSILLNPFTILFTAMTGGGR